VSDSNISILIAPADDSGDSETYVPYGGSAAQFRMTDATLVAFDKTPNDFHGTGVSDLLMTFSGSSNLVVGEVGSGGQLSYSVVGSIGASSTFIGNGDFEGRGASDIGVLTAAGQLDIYRIANGALQLWAATGLGPEWSFKETGTFLPDGKEQFLMENTHGAVVAGEFNSAGVASYSTVAALGSQWSFVGAGNYLGGNMSEFLLQGVNGALALGQAGSANGTGYTLIGGIASSWTIEESGDFLGDGKAQFLMHNTNGAVALGEVGSSGSVTYTQIGGLGSDWSFIGAGNYFGSAPESFLVQNTNGAIVAGTVVGGATQYVQVGAVGAGWTFHG
jgi:hypothetical protein